MNEDPGADHPDGKGETYVGPAPPSRLLPALLAGARDPVTMAGRAKGGPKRDPSRPRGGGSPTSNPSNIGELMDTTPVIPTHDSAPLPVDSVATADAHNPSVSSSLLSAPIIPNPAPVLPPSAQGSESQPFGAAPHLSGASLWNDQVDEDAANKFLPVNEKAA